MPHIQDRKDMYRQQTEADCDVFVLTALQRLGRSVYDAGSINAYINYGRWIANCPKCNSGIACSPGIAIVICLDCGARYSVVFPAERGDIEAALIGRAEMHRNWYPHESVGDLQRENREKGVG